MTFLDPQSLNLYLIHAHAQPHHKHLHPGSDQVLLEDCLDVTGLATKEQQG